MIKNTISIVIPIYNEQENIKKLFNVLMRELENLDNYSWEIIFVDDGSKDNSVSLLEQLIKNYLDVKILEFSRNFGKEIAITAGINNCRGEACLMMDADLQHPPKYIKNFIEKWEAGAEVVVGIRKKREVGGFKNLGSKVFYLIMKRISDVDMIPNSTDFRLIDRAVIDEFNKFTERNRMSRALIDWLGFRRDYVYYNEKPRMNGEARYSIIKLTRLAFNSFVGLSLFPLRLAGYLGIIITLASGILGLFIVIEKYILHDPMHLETSGPAQLAIIIVFLVGIILICLGLMALYIANIHGEVTNRPMYVIKKSKIKDQNSK